jgi:tetratricopeptide (TPR) repeat protein
MIRTRFWTAGIAIAVVVVVAGCTRLPASAMQRIEQGHRAYQAGRYSQSQHMLSPVIAQYRNEPDIAEALYVRGLCRLKTGAADAARNDFKAALRITDRDELRALLHAQLGNLEYEAGRYETAIGHYRAADRAGLPSQSPSDRVLQRYGESLQHLSRFREAKAVYADLMLRFPRSSAAAEVRRKGSWAKDYYSIQCGVYSKPESAQRAAAGLRQKGIRATAWREERNGSVRHVVRTGQYRTHAEARRALPAVRQVVPDAFIVP